MKILNALKKGSQYIFNISMALIFAMMCFMTLDALLQVIVGAGILGNYEIVEIMMVCIVYCAFGYTQTVGGHIAVDLIKGRFPPAAQGVLNLFISAITVIAGCIMVYASWKNVGDILHDGLETATLGIALYPFYGVVCLGCVVLTLMFIITLLENVIALFRPASPGD